MKTAEVVDSTIVKPKLEEYIVDANSEIAEEILTTSPKFLKMTAGLTERIIKNGGTSFGISLESMPDSEDDASYVFELHESYPDRSVRIAEFSFDVKKKQLYFYDRSEDAWMATAFDKKLLLKLEKIVK